LGVAEQIVPPAIIAPEQNLAEGNEQDLNQNLQGDAQVVQVTVTEDNSAADAEVVVAADIPVVAQKGLVKEGPTSTQAQVDLLPGLISGNAGTSTGIDTLDLDNASKEHISSQDIFNLASQHAFSVIDGSHLMSEEGIELWGKHFAPSPSQVASSFSSEIPVIWFNFILHLLLTPDKFEWTLHLLKLPLWQILIENCKAEETMTFCIPDKCSVSSWF
jgi:hypothetical protein